MYICITVVMVTPHFMTQITINWVFFFNYYYFILLLLTLITSQKKIIALLSDLLVFTPKCMLFIIIYLI